MMELAFQASTILSITLFLFCGLSCLFSDAMAAEFERFGLSRFRKLAGGLEVLGGLALIVGYVVPTIPIAASVGLRCESAWGPTRAIGVQD